MTAPDRPVAMRTELVCMKPARSASLALRTSHVPHAGPGQVLVRLEATSVNPIDLKRARGHGARLLGLKGAARFPLVLGNDVVGIVEALGQGITGLRIGQRVFGLVGTGKAGGAHASHVIVPQAQLVDAPGGVPPAMLAALPYSFTTMWQAVRALGIAAANAADLRVLVHGASGGLGQLSLQLLASWGARVTAICGSGKRRSCLAAGAEVAIERAPGCIGNLAADFDAILNFADGDDDLALATRLRPGALGLATTVHPLLAHFDRSGWLRGAWASRRDFARNRAAVKSRAPRSRYAWTLFKPDREALEVLATGVRERRFELPIGVEVPFDWASVAFAHVAVGKPGRALLYPCPAAC